ncbi:ABC transporter ATP-binding protein [Glycomyces paridis]|uniref:ABC transporter ATP-binding protein n=1 Tax=Glycomyces paridis TaxID=2126555 RepID=A0A4S8PGD3_9ACTN|nr:ABC transporter ATP-binding protein [Glycomyces paridis]THV29588.1 ABC transporter ATP-binding protein [Glycomyces paridis]
MLDNLAGGLRGYRDALALGYRANPKGVIANLALASAQAAVVPLVLYGVKGLIDGLQHGQAETAYWSAAAIGVGAAALWAITFGLIKFSFAVAFDANRAADRELMDLMGRPPGLDHHERPAYLDQVQRIREERGMLAMAVSWTGSWIQAVGTIGIGGWLLYRVHPLLLLFPLVSVAAVVAAKRAADLQIRSYERTSAAERLRRHLFEVATGAQSGTELRVFGSADAIGDRHLAVGRTVVDERNRGQRRSAWMLGTESLIGAVGMVAGVGLVLHLAVRGRASAGDVVLLIGLVGMVAGQIRGIAGQTSQLVQVGRLGRRLAWLRGYAAESGGPADPAPVPERLGEGITVEDVSFAYPEAERPSLDGVSLRLPAGKVVALVGENGAGKTTLVKLLSGFYRPTSGAIRVDGAPLAGFEVDAWRGRIGATFQDFTRFEFRARESVGVGDLRARFEDGRIGDAMRRAGAEGLLDELPEGLDTRLGGSWEGGTDLSGGQWQKLAIGRGRMREDPLLVVFDEPSAALDPQTEHALFERFAEEVRAGRRRGTVAVLVSHRFSTVSIADLIVVLKDGRVAESGTHAELMAEGGTYAELYGLQSAAYR